MSPARTDIVPYRRSRFATRLPVDRRYTPSHYWLREERPAVWRIGFTQFATRMLGDIVECEFSTPVGSTVSPGDEIGGVEGFKAITVVYAVASGVFQGRNGELDADITAIESDPYGRGWLYEVEGDPDPSSVDVHGYVGVLDATIDTMLAQRHREGHDDGET